MAVSRVIFLADMESFYASVEVARNPSLRGKPVVVCGDPRERRGIVLAASREAKAYGISTAMLAGECRKLCPQVVMVAPRMQEYLQVSLKITGLMEEYTDRVFPYSIDEQFMDMTGCEGMLGVPREAASRIIKRIWHETGIRCRIGMGENFLQAKMACDSFAKKNETGLFRLDNNNYSRYVWPLPVKKLFGVGRRMEQHLYGMGVRTIGQLAGLPRERLKQRWGVNGEVLWLNARGIDYSIMEGAMEEERKGVGHSLTLPRDYYRQKELEVVLLEVTEEVCRRARALGKQGRTVSLYCRGADFDNPTGFSRQTRLSRPSALTMEVYPQVLQLLGRHWGGFPVRAIGVSLSGLMRDDVQQLSFLDRREEELALCRAMDEVRDRFGPGSLFRLSSLTSGGQLFNRANKIGGHQA